MAGSFRFPKPEHAFEVDPSANEVTICSSGNSISDRRGRDVWISTYNIFSNDNGGIVGGSGTSVGGHLGPVSNHDNSFHDWANWDDTSNTNHHDGIHCFGSTGSTTSAAHFDSYYLYNNRF